MLAVGGRVVEAHGAGLDRDAALALEVHVVEHLRRAVARADGAGQLEQAVGQRRLAVVDVGDDREVADAGDGHAGSAGRSAAEQRPLRPRPEEVNRGREALVERHRRFPAEHARRALAAKARCAAPRRPWPARARARCRSPVRRRSRACSSTTLVSRPVPMLTGPHHVDSSAARLARTTSPTNT